MNLNRRSFLYYLPGEKFFLFVFLITVFLIFYYNEIFGNKVFFFRDIFFYFLPSKILFKTAIINGEFPLWNPYEFLGQPFAANPGTTSFNPFNILFLIFEPERAYTLFIISHYFIIIITTFFLSFHLTGSYSASAFSAIILGFSGYLVSSHNLLDVISFTFFPSIFFFGIRLIVHHELKTWKWLTLVFALSLIFGGEIAYTYLCLLLLLLIWFLESVTKGFDSGWKTEVPLKEIISLFRAGILSLLIAAFVFVPTVDLFLHTSRSSYGVLFSEATLWSLHPLRLIELYAPYFWGNLYPEDTFWGSYLIARDGQSFPWVITFYMGVSTLFFVVVTLFKLKENKLIFYLVLSSCISLILALGDHTQIYYYFSEILPFWGTLRHPEKFMLPFTFFLSMLCSMGFSISLHNKSSLRAPLIIYILLCIICPLLFTIYYKQTILSYIITNFAYFSPDQQWERILEVITRSILIVSVMCLIILWWIRSGKKIIQYLFLLLLLLDLLPVTTKAKWTTEIRFYNSSPLLVDYLKDINKSFRIFSYSGWKNEKLPPSFFPKNQRFERIQLFSKEMLLPQVGTVWNLKYGLSYSPLALKEYEDLKNYSFLFFKKLSQILSIKYWILSDFDSQEILKMIAASRNFHEYLNIKDLKLKIYESKDALPRVFVVSNFLKVNDLETARLLVLNQVLSLKEVAVISEPDGETSLVSIIKKIKMIRRTMPNGTAEIKADKFNKVIVEANLERDGMLILTDFYYPGWKVYIDGKKEEILRVNYFHRGVKLTKGRHEVVFIYRPVSLIVGISVTTIALFSLMIFEVYKYCVKIIIMKSLD